MQENFQNFLNLVWPADGDFDSPKSGYQITPGDPGGGTKGGVIEATWNQYVTNGLVSGSLQNATDSQLETVLHADVWGTVGDNLPSGLDVLVANGRMMTGRYGEILQQCLGFIGSDVDNDIGPITLSAAELAEPETLISALHGNHWRYLSGLSTWSLFGHGWTRRLIAAREASLKLVNTQSKT